MPAAVAVPLITAGVGAAASLAGAGMQSRANSHAADVQARAAQQAAELQARAAENALRFQQEQAAIAQQNFLKTQAFNRGVYQDQQARLEPYRRFGQGALAQLGMPIPGITL